MTLLKLRYRVAKELGMAAEGLPPSMLALIADKPEFEQVGAWGGCQVCTHAKSCVGADVGSEMCATSGKCACNAWHEALAP